MKSKHFIPAATLVLAITFTLNACSGDSNDDNNSGSAGTQSSSSKGNNGSNTPSSSDGNQSSSSSGGGTSSSSSSRISSSSVGSGDGQAIVGPLLKTQWNQREPYNNLLPIDDTGEHVIAGCGPIATSQIMKYHNHPKRGFEVNYDWDNMLNTYTSSATEQQRNAVATLVSHVFLGSNTKFLIDNFEYDRSIQVLNRRYFDDASWQAIIIEQLDAGLPIQYQGNNFANTNGHIWVADGYDNTGKIHMNWGWGGQYDGYYSLNALNNRADWNYGNRIIINIKPDPEQKSVGSNEMALDSFTVSKNSVPQNELFTVTAQIQSFGFFTGGQAGVALIDNSGNISAVVGIINFNSLNPQGTRTSTMNCFVPENLATGQYTLRIVTRTTDEDWKIVTVSDISKHVPNTIPITVTADKTIIGDSYGIAVTNLTTTKSSISQGDVTPFNAGAAFKNISSDAFPGGDWGIALVDNTDNIMAVLGFRDISRRNPEADISLGNVSCIVPASVIRGTYKLRMVIRPTGGEWKVVTMSYGVAPTSIGFTVQ